MLGRDRAYLFFSVATVVIGFYQNFVWRRTWTMQTDAAAYGVQGVDRLYRCADSIRNPQRSVLIH